MSYLGQEFVNVNVLEAATVTASGSLVVSGLPRADLVLLVSLGAATGTSPTITFRVVQLDPIDPSVELGPSVIGAALTGSETSELRLVGASGGSVLVEWTVAGTSPSFSAVDVVLACRAQSVISGVTATGEVVQVRTTASGEIYSVASPASIGSPSLLAIGTVTGSTSEVVVRSTPYTEQTANFQGSIVSDNAADAAAGTGLREVTIHYLDQAMGAIQTEDVVLNGTTPVNLVATDHCFIQKIVAKSAGSSLVNAGTITLKAGLAGAGATVWSIAPGANQTLGAQQYVPAGTTAKIHMLIGTADAGGTTRFWLERRDPSNANSPRERLTTNLQSTQLFSTVLYYPVPLTVEGPSVITVWCQASASVAQVGADLGVTIS